MGAVSVRHLILLTLAALTACASAPQDRARIRLGMTKDELTAELGQPLDVREPVVNQRGQTEEAWQYYLPPEVETGLDVARGVLTTGVGFFDDPTEGHRYLFVFIEDRLERWGPDNQAPRRYP